MIEVNDEGESWENEDKERPRKKIKFHNDKLDMLEKIMSEIEVENVRECFLEQLANILDEKLKRDYEYIFDL